MARDGLDGMKEGFFLSLSLSVLSLSPFLLRMEERVSEDRKRGTKLDLDWIQSLSVSEWLEEIEILSLELWYLSSFHCCCSYTCMALIPRFSLSLSLSLVVTSSLSLSLFHSYLSSTCILKFYS